MKPRPTNKLPLLISYAYLRDENKDVVQRIMENPDVELLVDSGAFSALNAGKAILLDEYIEFLHKWKNRLFGYIALDKLQDPDTTATNLKEMIRAGLKPIPVHVLGDDRKRMDELFELSDWVALGGLRRPQRGPAPYSYVKQKMEWANGRRVHWLGFTDKPMLQAFRPYSCDSSSWTAGMMYGRITLYLGNGEWVTCNRKEMIERRLYHRETVKRALNYYEVSVSDFLDERQWHNGNQTASIPARECMITKLPARSWVRYVLELQDAFDVRYFIATNSNKAEWLINAFELVMRKGIRHANNNLRDNAVRKLSPVAGRSGRSRISQRLAPAQLSRSGGKASPA